MQYQEISKNMLLVATHKLHDALYDARIQGIRYINLCKKMEIDP